MDEYQRYVFDTQGGIVLPEALTPAEVERLVSGFPRGEDGQAAREPENGLLTYDEPLFRKYLPGHMAFNENRLGPDRQRYVVLPETVGDGGGE